MLKCLQIIGDSKYGGGTYLILEWCRYLRARHCQVEVLSTDRQTIEELTKIKGVRIIQDIFIPREIAPLVDFRAFLQLLHLLRHKKYDFVHTYSATPGVLGRIAARLAGVPVIVHHQAAWAVSEHQSPLVGFMYRLCEYLCTLFSTKGICVSHAVAEEARQLNLAPPGKLVTICNGIEPRRFIEASEKARGQELRRELSIPEDCLLIGSTGRLAPMKDYDSLVRAMPYLSSLLPNSSVRLLVTGDGPDRHHLEALVHSQGLDDQVQFLGFRQDIPAFLAALDIFVTSSLREGLSISLLEAMAAAKPIVATAILPNAELIEPEVTGLLVSPKAPEEIARAIARFVQEPELAEKCAGNARQRVLQDYTIDRMLSQTWDLYLGLLQENYA